MSTVQSNSTVKVHYTGTLESGEVFDSSINRDPLEFTMGQGMLIPGFENAVLGLKVGDVTTANIPSAEAYGEHNPQNVVTVGKEQLPPELEVKEGMQLQMNTDAGQPIPCVVTRIEDDQVTIDANHPLAGKDLTFNIEIIEIL